MSFSLPKFNALSGAPPGQLPGASVIGNYGQSALNQVAGQFSLTANRNLVSNFDSFTPSAGGHSGITGYPII